MKIRDHLLLFLASLFFATAAPAADVDPPGRVGRIAYLEGNVGFRVGYDGAVDRAGINWPVSSDNFVSTDGGGRAEVQVGSTTIRVDRNSDLEVAGIDDWRIRLRLLVGSVALRVRSRDLAGEIQVATPAGILYPQDAGSYRVDFGRSGEPVTVQILDGSARFEGGASVLSLVAGQRLEFWNDRSLRTTEARRDDFDAWILARERRDASLRARYVSPEMTGYEDLEAYGMWRETPDYGAVWYPSIVPVGWAPYRWGHWAWILPWGWTWIDDMPWGFAPFHYGRWVLLGGVWAWVPGRVVPRPVYAPALVGWIGQPGWSVSIGVGSVPAVGWFPLAPREAYYPTYRCSPGHRRDVNAVYGVGTWDRPPDHYSYQRHQRAVTVVPADVMRGGGGVRQSSIPFRGDRDLHRLPPPVTAPLIVEPRPRRGMPDGGRRNEDGSPRTAPLRPDAGAARPASGFPSPPPGEIRPGPRGDIQQAPVAPARPSMPPAADEAVRHPVAVPGRSPEAGGGPVRRIEPRGRPADRDERPPIDRDDHRPVPMSAWPGAEPPTPSVAPVAAPRPMPSGGRAPEPRRDEMPPVRERMPQPVEPAGSREREGGFGSPADQGVRPRRAEPPPAYHPPEPGPVQHSGEPRRPHGEGTPAQEFRNREAPHGGGPGGQGGASREPRRPPQRDERR